MKRILLSPLIYAGLFITGILLICSCNKSADSSTASYNFNWTFKGTNLGTNSDSAFTTSLGSKPLIVATLNHQSVLRSRKISFSITSLSPGTYTISNGGANILEYIDDLGFVLGGTSGQLIITTNSNNRLTGNFSAILIDVSSNTFPVSGSFTNMAILP